MSEENHLLRNIAVVFIVVVVAVLLAVHLYSYLATAKVTIKTDSPTNYVRITQSADTSSGSKLFSKDAKQQLSVRVRPGSYQISVYVPRGQNSTSQTIKVKARQNLSYTINPVAAVNPDPVYGKQAGSVFVDSTQLLFLSLSSLSDNSQGSGSLLRADSSGSFSKLFPDHSFTKIAWANSQLGLAQDAFNNLYVIQNGQLSQIGLPFMVNSGTKLSSDINRDGEVYVSNGRSVYSGSVSGNFKRIYTADSDEAVSSLSAGNKRVALVTNVVEALESKRNGSRANGSIAVISDSGSVTKKSFGALGVSWSPNYNYLLVEGALSEGVFDSSLRQINAVAVNNAGNFSWYNNHSVFYSVYSQVWLYDLQTKKSTRVTSLFAGWNVTNIYPAKDGSYVYFSGGNSSKAQLFRAALRGQAIDNSLSSLTVFLPEVVHGCSLNYVNFNKPTILVGPPAGQDPADCMGTANEEVQYYGISTNKVGFVTLSQTGE